MSLTPANETAGAPVTETPATPPPEAAPAAPPPAVEPPAAPAVEKLTPKFVELARREKRAVEAEKALKDREAAAKRYEDVAAKAKDDPFAVLESLGLNLDALIEKELRRGKPETTDERLERLEKERAEEKKAAETEKLTTHQAAMKAQVDGVRASVRDFVTSKADDYELVNAQEAHEEVFNVLAQHFEETGEMLDVAKAAAMVEDFLFDRASVLAKSSKKIAALFKPAEAVPPAVNPLLARAGDGKFLPKAATPPAASPKPATSFFVDNSKGGPAPKPMAKTLSNSLHAPAKPVVPAANESRDELAERVKSKFFKR